MKWTKIESLETAAGGVAAASNQTAEAVVSNDGVAQSMAKIIALVTSCSWHGDWYATQDNLSLANYT
jgi:hypothetical protein